MNQKQNKYHEKLKQPVAWVGKMKDDKDWRWASTHQSSVKDVYDIVKPLFLEANND